MLFAKEYKWIDDDAKGEGSGQSEKDDTNEED